MAVTSTACAGAPAGEEEVAEAAGVVLVGAAAAIVVLGAATGAELGAAAGDEDVAEAAGAFGVVGVTAATAAVGKVTAGEAGVAALEGAAVACPNIFDMRLLNIPIGVKYAPLRGKKPVSLGGYTSAVVRLAICTKARGVEKRTH